MHAGCCGVAGKPNMTYLAFLQMQAPLLLLLLLLGTCLIIACSDLWLVQHVIHVGAAGYIAAEECSMAVHDVTLYRGQRVPILHVSMIQIE